MMPQSPPESLIEPLHQMMNALIAKELMRHLDMNVNISVAFALIIKSMTLKKGITKVDDSSKSSSLLKSTITSTKKGNITMLNSYSAMDDKSEEDVEMVYDESANLQSAKTVGSFSDSTANVLNVEKIITMIKEKSKKLAIELQALIRTSMKKDNQSGSPVCWQFGEKVLMICAAKLKPNDRMSIIVYKYSKMVAHICETTSEMVFVTLACTD
ncbi:phospholipase-like protein, partial [Tanacetum coccineum]